MFLKKIFFIEFLLLIPLVFSEISINNYYWKEGENHIIVNFTYIPDLITFNHSQEMIYQKLSQLDNFTYEAVFFVENSTESNNYAISIITPQHSKSFTIFFNKTMKINESQNLTQTNETQIIEKKYPFDFTKTEFYLLISICAVVLLAVTILIIQLDRARKLLRK